MIIGMTCPGEHPVKRGGVWLPQCNRHPICARPEQQYMHGGLGLTHLTHWGRDKMNAISQTIFSSAFLWMKMLEFLLRFLWNLFLMAQLTIFQHWFRLWLGAVQATSHYLNQWWLVYWRIYASLGLNDLTHWDPNSMADILKSLSTAILWNGIFYMD